MKVRVLAFGGLREAAGIDTPGLPVEVDVPEGGSVADVAGSLGLDPTLVVNVLVDGLRADLGAPVAEGSEVTLMPAFSGGER